MTGPSVGPAWASPPAGGAESPPASGGGGSSTKLIVGIGAAGTAATLLGEQFGVPRWLTAGAFVAYGVTIGGLVTLAVCSTGNPPRQWMAYRLLKVLVPWLPGLAEAVKPGAVERAGPVGKPTAVVPAWSEKDKIDPADSEKTS